MNTLKISFIKNARIVTSIALILWAAALPVFADLIPVSLGADCGDATNCLKNPLRFTSIEQFVQGTLQAIVMIGLPVITVFVVYAGFKFVAARGNPGEISKAKENFVYVIIGAALILGAWVLATLIGGTISQLLGPSSGGSIR